MQKRAFIIHGWDGNPDEGWFPWLKRELESRSFVVAVPAMPDSEEPRITKWVPALREVVGTPDEQTYFIGHSMGCQAIARYLEGLPDGMQVGGAVFVAGFFKRLTNLEGDKEHDVTQEWLTTPLDLEKAKSHLPNSVAIFSDDDMYVPLENQEEFRDQLGSTILIEHARGHFSGSTGTVELPIALEAVMKMAE